MTPQTFGRIVWTTAYFAIALVIALGYVTWRQHTQLTETCRYALASTSPEYVTSIRKELAWCE